MVKKLFVFVLAFCLSLALIQFLRSKRESNSVEIISNSVAQNGPLPALTNKQISFNNISAFEKLLHNFQESVAKNDKEAVVSLLKFPVDVYLRGKNDNPHLNKIKSEKELLLNYDKIFDNSFKKCISRSEPENLSFSTSGDVFNSAIRMRRIYENSGTNFDIKVIQLYRC